MVWRRLGGKPLSEPMLVSLLTLICVAWPHKLIMSWNWHELYNVNMKIFPWGVPVKSMTTISPGTCNPIANQLYNMFTIIVLSAHCFRGSSELVNLRLIRSGVNTVFNNKNFIRNIQHHGSWPNLLEFFVVKIETGIGELPYCQHFKFVHVYGSCLLIWFLLGFVPSEPVNNRSALVRRTARQRSCNRPSFEPVTS